MGRLHLLSMKGSVIGIFITLILILTIPLLFLLTQQNKLLSSKRQQEPTPTPAALAFAKGEGVIAGYVYHDKNRDGKREAEEKPFPNVKMQMKILTEENSQQKVFDTITDTYGYFNFKFPSNSNESYMVKIMLPKGYQTVDSNPVIISNLTPNTEKIVEFGLTLPGNITPTPTRKPTPTPKQATPTPQP